jgi:hypothetical protein
MRLLLAPLVLLSGCALVQPPMKFTGPHGQQAYLMQCSGMLRSIEGCKERAEKLCPTGYEVVDRPTGVPGLQQMAGGMLIVPDKTLAVECKAG